MVYLDLDELPQLVGVRGLIGSHKLARNSFLRADHLFNSAQSLDEEVRQLVQKQTGTLPRGPIRLLTQLRHFGHYFSPLNLFYCFDQTGEQVESVLAEVSNTPWNERHVYTLWSGNHYGPAGSLDFSHAKEFHVSPFMGMEMNYEWKLSQPTADLNIQLRNIEGDRELFRAKMAMQRRELNRVQLNRMSLRYPLMTAQIGVSIYLQALKLWWKKCPFYTHPTNLSSSNRPMTIDRAL